MSGGICKIGDLVVGTCQANAPGHPRQFTGTWISGSSDVTVDGVGVVRTGDIGVTDCGHTIQAIVGSDTVTSNGIGVVRVGDPVIVLQGGQGIAVTGSEDTISG